MKGSTLHNLAALTAVIAVATVGFCLVIRSHGALVFDEAGLVRNIMHLDAWSGVVLVAAILVGTSKVGWRWKGWALAGLLAIFGGVAADLILAGTPFAVNGDAGDQSFRMAMILKFMQFLTWDDFYYAGLPSFYPPLYYYGLAILGKISQLQHWELLKVGTLLIYVVGPVVTYRLWLKSLGPFRAWVVTASVFAACALLRPIPLYSPPAFIANAMFFPWWLAYVTGNSRNHLDWRQIFLGSLIGAATFMIYPYPFLVGVIMIALVGLCRRRIVDLIAPGGMIVLLLSALFSAIYWLPPALSILVHGSKPMDQEWHHLGHTGLLKPLTEFDVSSILVILGLIYLVKHRSNRKFLTLLYFALAVAIAQVLGHLAGAMDRPINVAKARELMTFACVPAVGIMIAGVTRWMRSKNIVAAAIIVCTLLVINTSFGLTNYVTSDLVRRARETVPKNLNRELSALDVPPGSVFLASDASIPSYYPVYLFTSINQHYAHPASRYQHRLRFLTLLQSVSDPAVMNIALHHNQYDAVDYFWPRGKGRQLQLTFILSNYPIGSKLRTLTYDPGSFSDPHYFRRERIQNLFRVLSPSVSHHRDVSVSAPYEGRRNYSAMTWLIGGHLSEVGRTCLSTYTRGASDSWTDCNETLSDMALSDSVTVVGACYQMSDDSVHLVIAFEANHRMSTDYKIYLHVFEDGPEGERHNYDFKPANATSRWPEHRIELCTTTIPITRGDASLVLGLFKGTHRMPGEYFGRFSKTNRQTSTERSHVEDTSYWSTNTAKI